MGLLDHDRGSGAEGAEGTGLEDGLSNVSHLPHREVPPDVTVGEEELDVGAWEEVEEDEEVPVFPVVPVFPEALDVPFEVPLPSSEVALPSSEVVAVEDPAVEADVVLPTELPPGRSCDTTIPTAAVAPVAAMIAPLVRTRSRDLALSLSAGVFGWVGGDMSLPFLGLVGPDATYPTMRGSTPTENRLWSSCDIAHGGCRVVPRYDRPRPPTEQGRGGDDPGQHGARTG